MPSGLCCCSASPCSSTFCSLYEKSSALQSGAFFTVSLLFGGNITCGRSGLRRTLLGRLCVGERLLRFFLHWGCRLCGGGVPPYLFHERLGAEYDDTHGDRDRNVGEDVGRVVAEGIDPCVHVGREVGEGKHAREEVGGKAQNACNDAAQRDPELRELARAAAWLDGRDFVAPEDVAGRFPAALRHRVRRSAAARAEGLSRDEALARILAATARPALSQRA